MAAFRFRLQAVLRMREETRDECRQELARALQAGQILSERKESVRDEMEQLVGQLRQGQAAGEVAVDQVLELRRYEMILKLQLADVGKQLQQVETEIERRRQVLAHADQEVRVLEKLKESQYQSWLRGAQRREQQLLDEVAGQQYFRHNSQEVES